MSKKQIVKGYKVFGSGSFSVGFRGRSTILCSEMVAAIEEAIAVSEDDGDNGFIGTRSAMLPDGITSYWATWPGRGESSDFHATLSELRDYAHDGLLFGQAEASYAAACARQEARQAAEAKARAAEAAARAEERRQIVAKMRRVVRPYTGTRLFGALRRAGLESVLKRADRDELIALARQ